MVPSKYPHIARVEFPVAMNCTGHCAHCSVGDGLNRHTDATHLSPDVAARALGEICDMYPVTSVMTFGGEPLLFPDTVCAIHRQAAQHGGRTFDHHGCFTRSPEKIGQRCRVWRLVWIPA